MGGLSLGPGVSVNGKGSLLGDKPLLPLPPSPRKAKALAGPKPLFASDDKRDLKKGAGGGAKKEGLFQKMKRLANKPALASSGGSLKLTQVGEAAIFIEGADNGGPGVGPVGAAMAKPKPKKRD